MLYRIARFILRVLFRILFRVHVIGRENVPETGSVMLCANHTSNLDPVTVGIPLERKVHYMAKAELFRVPVLGWLITQFGAFPVKRGGISKESIRNALKILNEGKVMGIFPEGSRHNQGGAAKKGAASMAMKAGAAIVPVAIAGNYKLFGEITVIYGNPLDLSEFADHPDGSEGATELIMSSIRKMIDKRAPL
jgi:1-acyl-sn-glycerol-3-phosphate acyltransferase